MALPYADHTIVHPSHSFCISEMKSVISRSGRVTTFSSLKYLIYVCSTVRLNCRWAKFLYDICTYVTPHFTSCHCPAGILVPMDWKWQPGVICNSRECMCLHQVKQFGNDYSMSGRSVKNFVTCMRRIWAIAFPGLRLLGHARAQFIIVWQRPSLYSLSRWSILSRVYSSRLYPQVPTHHLTRLQSHVTSHWYDQRPRFLLLTFVC